MGILTGYQMAMDDIAHKLADHGEAGALAWVVNNRHEQDGDSQILRDRLTELYLPAGNMHPADKRRAEALTLFVAVIKAREFGEPDIIEEATDAMLSFVQVLFGIASAEIDAAIEGAS